MCNEYVTLFSVLFKLLQLVKIFINSECTNKNECERVINM